MLNLIYCLNRRKRGEKNEDTAQNLIVRKLTLERINELKEEIEKDKKQLENLKKNISLLNNDNLSETDMKIIENQMIEQLKQKERDEEAHQLWLKEREEKYASMIRKKSFGFMKTPRKDDQTPSTPIKSTASSIVSSNQEENQQQQIIDTDKNSPNPQDDAQSKAIKQESIVQELNEPVKTTKSKDDKVQIIVINEEKQIDKQVTDKSIEQTKDDKQVNKDLSNKGNDKIEITVVKSVVKMEIDNVEKNVTKEDGDEKLVENKEENKEEQEKNKETTTESIASNKRKRTSTSTSSNLSSSNIVAQQTPPTATTRRSGRIKPLRSSISLNTPTSTSKLETTVDQQKRTQIDESNIITMNASQLILNDDSTKDSTTSDLTDTYTSPNSPASSIINVEHTDPEQIKEQKEYKAWKKSILMLLREAATHKYSSLFTSPVTDDEAKGYSTVVYRPIDLTMIKKRIESGTIKTTAEFQRDIMLMFQNAIMYNSVKHEVHQMTLEMQKEILESIEDFIDHHSSSQNISITNNQKNSQINSSNKETPSSSRRKSRTLS